MEGKRETAKAPSRVPLSTRSQALRLSWQNGRMQDHQLYQRILGIEGPWQVERVDLQLKEGEVHVYLTHEDNREWACAECGVLCPLYDHQPERQWRHLDTCQYRTLLHAEPPRSQ